MNVVGIDLGGTAIKHGLVNDEGALAAHDEQPTPKGPAAILTAMALLVEGYRKQTDLGAVGVGTAGAVDFASGTVIGHSPNIPGWEGTAVASALGGRIGLPVAVDNDANCMAVAEASEGAGKGCRSVFFLTLGTGVGSAFVHDGNLWRGSHSMGGEFGHATIVKDGRICSCGQRGHLEAYASARALVKRTLELARQGLPSMYESVNVEAATAIGALEVFKAARGGDAAAAQAVSEVASYLAAGIASAVNLLDPDRVVVGGGMAKAGASFVKSVENEVRTRVHAGVADLVEVVPATLGNRAGLIGAASLARELASRSSATPG